MAEGVLQRLVGQLAGKRPEQGPRVRVALIPVVGHHGELMPLVGRLGVPGLVGSSVSTKEYWPAPGLSVLLGATAHPLEAFGPLVAARLQRPALVEV